MPRFVLLLSACMIGVSDGTVPCVGWAVAITGNAVLLFPAILLRTMLNVMGNSFAEPSYMSLLMLLPLFMLMRMDTGQHGVIFALFWGFPEKKPLASAMILLLTISRSVHFAMLCAIVKQAKSFTATNRALACHLGD